MKKKLFFSFALALTLVLTAWTTSTLASPSRNNVSIAESSGAVSSEDTTIELVALDEHIPFECAPLSPLGAISTKQALIIDGTISYLYCTFDEPNIACELLRSEIPELLQFLKNEYNLPEFSYGTWSEYWGKSINMHEVPSNSADINQQAVVFNCFADIMCNATRNEEIIQYISARGPRDLSKLATMLPYTSDLPEDLEIRITPESRATAQIFNKSKGNSYAIRYAENPNIDGYGLTYTNILGIEVADCTNFVSQILESGDIKQHDYFPDAEKGWWHAKMESLHWYSNTWQRAHEFSGFMGRSDITQSLYTFSRNIAKDYFIALDFTGTGSFDHMGYIVQVGTYNTYNGKYYRDFKIAQHTSNYLDWVSKDINHWDDYDNVGKYCIVRKQ